MLYHQRLFLFNATHNPDLQAEPEDAPDACSHPEMTLPTRMTPFIQHDLSPPTRVDCSRPGKERRGKKEKEKEKKGADAAKKKSAGNESIWDVWALSRGGNL